MSIEARFQIDRGEFNLDVDLCFPSRGVSAIFGQSGSGKTTLLRAIAGLEKTSTGFLKVGDSQWQNGRQFLPPHKRSVGYVFQEPSLLMHLDVQGNIDYGRKRVAQEKQKVAVEEAIDLLGIGDLLQRQPSQLSGGEQQRVAIARALATSPSVLLMDEPLASLDGARKDEILPYFESLHRQLDIPMLYVSHSKDEVMRMGDHMVLLDKGRALATGEVSDIFSRLDLPIAHDRDATSVLEAEVAEFDEEFGLAYLDFPGGRFAVENKGLRMGRPVRLLLRASDISIALDKTNNSSILNVCRAKIVEITRDGGAHITAKILLGDVPVITRITRKSATALGLSAGMEVYAQIKSVALLV